jgi:hypothetical protein
MSQLETRNLAVPSRPRGSVTLLSEQGGGWSGEVLAHELGHSEFGMPDEYRDHKGTGELDPVYGCHADTSCLHSLMGGYFNFGICTRATHGQLDFPAIHFGPNWNDPFQARCQAIRGTAENRGVSEWTPPAWSHLPFPEPGNLIPLLPFRSFAPLSTVFTQEVK